MATTRISTCGYDRLVPFTEAEVERLQLRDDFNFWAAVAELERDGVDPSLLHRYLRIVLLAHDERRQDFLITPGRIHVPEIGERRVVAIEDLPAVYALVNGFDWKRNEYGLLITAEASAGDLDWLHRIPIRGSSWHYRAVVFDFAWGMWTLDERGPSGMAIRSAMRLVDHELIVGNYSDPGYDVLRLEADGWRMNGGALRPYSVPVEKSGDKPLRVDIARDVQAARFMPVLDRLYVEQGANSTIIAAIEPVEKP